MNIKTIILLVLITLAAVVAGDLSLLVEQLESKGQATIDLEERDVFLEFNGKRELPTRTIWNGTIPTLGQTYFSLTKSGNDITGEIRLFNNRKCYTIENNNGVYTALYNEETTQSLFPTEDHHAPAQIRESRATELPFITVPAGIDVNALNSNPDNATGVIMIDRDGHTLTGTWWNDAYGSPKGGPIEIVPATISDDEYYMIWLNISELFAPFNLTVTTSQDVYDSYPTGSKVKAFVSDDISWQDISPGGASWFTAYQDESHCLISSSYYGSTPSAKRVWDISKVVAHELGHCFTLRHHKDPVTGSQYYPGHGTGSYKSKLWGAVLGSNYSIDIHHWAVPEYTITTVNRDEKPDISEIINNNGLAFRTDDHGNNLASATNLAITGGTTIDETVNRGIITERTDVDLFKFQATAGNFTVTASPNAYQPNLDIKIDLLDESGNVITSADPASIAPATISTTISSAGTYYLRIDGVGYLDTYTGYSDYGSLGYYSLSGSIPFDGEVFTLSVTNGDNSGSYPEGTEVTITAKDSAGYSFDSWTGDVSALTDANAKTTVVTMPGNSIAVTATYSAIETFTLTVENGTPSGEYVEGEEITITAHDSVGYLFDGWIGDTVHIDNPQAKSVTVTMPSQNITLTATYREFSLKLLDQSNIDVDTSSSEWGNGYGNAEAVDGKSETFWYTAQGVTLPQSVTFVLSEPTVLTGFNLLPRQDESDNGRIAVWRAEVSANGSDWSVVKEGTWDDSKDAKIEVFDTKTEAVSYVRITALSANNGDSNAAIAEFNLYYEEGGKVSLVKTVSVTPKLTAHFSGKRLNLSVPQSGNYSVAVTTLRGQVVFKQNRNFTAGTSSIELSSLSSGVYLIRVAGKGVNRTFKQITTR